MIDNYLCNSKMKRSVLSEININNIIQRNDLNIIPKKNISILDQIPTKSDFHSHFKQNFAAEPKLELKNINILSKPVKTIAPQLVDVKLERKLNRALKIHNALKKQEEGFFVSLYRNWIKPNIVLICFFVFLIVFFYFKCNDFTRNKKIQKIPIRQKITDATLQTLYIKPCGHKLSQSCLCTKKTATKEDIIKSVNTLPTNPPIILPEAPNRNIGEHPKIKSLHSDMRDSLKPPFHSDMRELKPSFHSDMRDSLNSNDFNWWSPNPKFNDHNQYLSDYVIEPPFSTK